MEAQARDDILQQETEIKAIAKAVGPMPNTRISKNLMQSLNQYQAHLERISDYLIRGPGIWWKQTSEGVEFFDGSMECDFRPEGPKLTHFRSSLMSDIELQLQLQWEDCCSSGIKLPAVAIKQYESGGQLQQIIN